MAPSNPPDVRRRTSLLLMAGAAGVGILDAIQFQLGAELRNDGGDYFVNFAASVIPWLWLAALLPGVVWLAERWPVDGPGWRRHLGLHLAAMTVFAFLHISGAIASGVAFAEGPVKVQFMATKLFLFRFPIDALAYWGAVAVAHAVRAVAVAREREQAAATLEKSLVETKLAALRDRLNPHFVFNTLNAVNTLALRQDHAGVIRTVDALSDLLRATLTDRKGHEGTVGQELEFLDRYLEIERLRLGERVTFVVTVDDAIRGALMPVMLIQPLVENAVIHGAAVKPGPVRIEVGVRRAGDQLRLEVSDTGPGFGAPRSGNGNGIGLASSRVRLSALYGGAATLECRNGDQGGARVTVTLPLRFPSVAKPA